uniref:histone deacetylase n=1 Tax=Phallusia mammillata TaxID=59560 RepID=A0A6F9DDP0_9ASCI|nr:histone deacetylase 9 [Phallusia mammillata]
MMSNENKFNLNNDLGDGKYKEKYHRLREQHEIDKRVLLAQFHYQTNTLQQQHQHQLQEHLKMFLAHQKDQQQLTQPAPPSDERKLMHSVKAKEKQSAIASNAVKKHLQKFVIDRQKVKGRDYSGVIQDRSLAYRWTSNLEGSSEHNEVPSVMGSPLNKFDDFPLRKTASEPNLKVKSRLKQKLSSDQRCSPLLMRRNEIKTDIANRIKKKLSSEKTDNSGNVGSMSLSDMMPHTHKDSPFLVMDPNDIHEENSPCDLYSSPSLPNISLALSQKQPDAIIFSHRKDDLNRSVGRTTSLPGATGHPSAKLDQWFFQQGDNGYQAKPSLPPGPIRSHQHARPHKALSRTRSAPTTASSQLQHHILQKKQQRMLQQQHEQQRRKTSMIQMDIAQHLNDEKKHQINNNRPEHPDEVQMKKVRHKVPQFPLFLNPNLPASYIHQHLPQLDEPTIPQDLCHLVGPEVPSFTAAELSKRSVLPTVAAHRPLMRTQSSPASSFLKKLEVKKDYRFTTGIAYSAVMLKHGCACGDDHIENSGRLEAIWKRLKKCGILSEKVLNHEGQCELIDARKATTDELQLVHTQEHTLRYGTTSLARKELDLASKFIVLPCGGVGVDNGIDIDTVWNELATINAARMAVGCTVDLAILVAENKLKNGFALVRPPGHHAQKNLAMAFCYFNSVAVAARKLQSMYGKDYKKILIIDWDVHHCNGTQNIFYADPTVLVVSVHRYDDGHFFPGTGSLEEIGTEDGIGFNVNIGFSNSLNPPMTDADYIAVFRTLVMPIAHQFNPDFVFVSCGFSPARGHPPALGGYNVSPKCFGFLTDLVLQLAKGKVVMALEGGFELNALSDCAEICINSLLGKQSESLYKKIMMESKPSINTVKCIEDVISIQVSHWKCLESVNVHQSFSDWQLESSQNEACNAMASLSVQNHTYSEDDGTLPTSSTSQASKELNDKTNTDCEEDTLAFTEDSQKSDQTMTVDMPSKNSTVC